MTDSRDFELNARGINVCEHQFIVTRWSTQVQYRVAELVMCQKCARIFEWQQLVDRDSRGKEFAKVLRGTSS
jgi:hypothetical protein